MSDNKLGHRQRLREKFLKAGLSGFLDYEIIELLLILGSPRRDCREPAKRIIHHFRSLRAAFEASPQELCRITGVGTNNVIGIRLIHEVARRFLREKMMSKPVCHSSREVFDYLYHSLRDARREKFKVIFLDAKNQILEEKTLSEGTVDSSVVYPREIIRQALHFNASAMIFAHNHPSGDPAPSQHDKAITRELILAVHVMQIQVLDHIIIGNNRYFSFADAGLILEYELDCRGIK